MSMTCVSMTKDRIGSNVKTLKKYEIEWNLFFKNYNLVESDYEKIDIKKEEKMTWTNNKISSKIDKLYYYKGLNMKCKCNEIKETSKSDHKAVFITCKFHTVNKKKENIKKFKPWRLKDIILEDEIVKEGIKEICNKIH